MHYDVIILGSGPAGLSAAIYTGRAGLSCAVLTGPEEGGKLALTDKIENYAGIGQKSGLELIEQLKAQVANSGIKLFYETAQKFNFEVYPFSIQTDQTSYQANAIIIAMGCKVNWLGLKSESKFKGKGISVCATCDGFFYKNKEIAVIGGGNTAVYEALHLSKIASKVYLISKTPKLNAEKILLDRLTQQKNIFLHSNTEVIDFIGKDKLSHLKLRISHQKKTFLLPIAGCFEAIGFHPNTSLFKGILSMDEEGYLLTNPRTGETSLRGIFACGDIQQPQGRQAIIAAGSGAIAALNVQRWLDEKLS